MNRQRLNSNYYRSPKIKCKSPKIKCFLDKIEVLTLIDSGAEINVIDSETAHSAGIGIVKSNEVVKAANQLPLNIVGQTSVPVNLKCPTDNGMKVLKLGFMLVVQGLGVQCLIGEPGKETNNIICLPKQKLVIFVGHNDIKQTPYYTEQHRYVLARAPTATTLKPGDQICYSLPQEFANTTHVTVTPRQLALPWLKPSVSET